MPILSIDDLKPMLFADIEDDKKIYIEDGYLILDYSYKYEIALDRIATPEDVLGWVLHLSDKTWMTKDRIKNFIEKCALANNTDYFCG